MDASLLAQNGRRKARDIATVTVGVGLDITLGRRRVVTLYGERRFFPGLVAELDGSTWRRRLVRGGLKRLVQRGFGEVRESSKLEDTEALIMPLLGVAVESGNEPMAWAVMWPSGDRSHRRYVLAMGKQHITTMFAKVSTRPGVDGPLFRREHSILTHLAHQPLASWRVPRSVGTQESDELASIVLSALPQGRRHLRWSEIFPAIPVMPFDVHRKESVEPVGSADVEWPDGLGQVEMSTRMTDMIDCALARPIPLGLVHGDVRRSNAIADKRGVCWLYDWEFGSLKAPRYTDTVGSRLNQVACRRRRSSDEALTDEWRWRVLEAGVRRAGGDIADLCVSVRYLAGLKHPAAMQLLRSPGPSCSDGFGPK